MKIFLALAILLLSAFDAALAQDKSAGPIVWQLKNPFRYFTDADHTAMHRKAFQALSGEQKGEPVLAVERALAAKSGGRGWAEAVFQKVMDEACWYSSPKTDAAAKGKGGEPCGAYIKPKTYDVLLSAPGTTGPCTWVVAAQTLKATDCRRRVEAKVPYGVKTEVVLNTPDRQAVARATIDVDDVLVVGLGDSFAAGEGNPDEPVSYQHRHLVDYDMTLMPGYPKRDQERPSAGWTHRFCHRSLYSHQLRVALQLAIEDPAQQRSVTFVGLGCTGATILDLFDAYRGREEPASPRDKGPSRRTHQVSQLSMLSRVLCEPQAAKVDKTADYNTDRRLDLKNRAINILTCPAEKRLRTPDLLLLSVGGNDVGFSGLVAKASLKKRALVIPKLFDEDPTISVPTAKHYLKRLPLRYEALGEALAAIMGKDASGRVLLTTYPQMGFDEDGKVCPTDDRGFDVADAWRLNSDVVAEVEEFVETDLTPAMAKAAADAGWVFGDTVRASGKFRSRGICSTTAAESEDPSWSNAAFPRYSYEDPVGWGDYKPDEYRPYRTTQRWFRTPNDAFLSAQYSDGMRGPPEYRVITWIAFSGAFHPNAEGQAAIADSVLKQAREILARRPKTNP